MRYAKVNELTLPLHRLNNEMIKILQMVDFNAGHVEAETGDPNELMLLDTYRSIIDKLEGIHNQIEYLQKEIVDEGRLSKNSAGRYELPSGEYFTSGSPIEALIFDDWDEVEKWVTTRVEHNGDDYYLYGHSEVKMEGLLARKRR